MEAKDTILAGCELLSLGFESSDYVACPLSPEEQKVCRQRLQYQAGIKEVMEWIEQYAIHGSQVTIDCMLIDLKIHSPYGKPSSKSGR